MTPINEGFGSGSGGGRAGGPINEGTWCSSGRFSSTSDLVAGQGVSLEEANPGWVHQPGFSCAAMQPRKKRRVETRSASWPGKRNGCY